MEGTHLNRRTKATDISAKVRRRVYERDGGCIFCRALGERTGLALQVMHYIPRSKGGLGIEENLAAGCIKHHMELDQSVKRNEMLAIFKGYLSSLYDDWSEDKLIYSREKEYE